MCLGVALCKAPCEQAVVAPRFEDNFPSLIPAQSAFTGSCHVMVQCKHRSLVSGFPKFHNSLLAMPPLLRSW